MGYNDRFKDAAWFSQSTSEYILVVGAGGIGSNALYCLAKTIPANYYVVDFDTVEAHNIGTQFFMREQIGKKKVQAIQSVINKFNGSYLNSCDFKYSDEYFPITITALDNMETRKKVFEIWKQKDDRELFIDGRLRANLYEIYFVRKGDEAKYEATLFDDKDVDDGPCTFKQTAYFGMLIGSRITHGLVNYLTNKYSQEEVCNLPFKVQEFGEPFYINIE